MARKKSTKPADTGALLTLTEVSEKTGISMPTLQRYKKLYQARIPSEGSGRTQRYRPEALDVFRELKEENIKKRGRPRKSAATASASKPKKAAKKKTKKATPAKKGAAKKAPAKSKRAVPKKKSSGSSGELLTLTAIGEQTGISYPTLLRYVKNHLSKIPHVGSGRKRRFKPAAVEVFENLRAQSPRGRAAAAKGRPSAKGRRPATKAKATKSTDAGMASRVKALETSHARLIKAIERLEKAVHKPLRLVVKR